MAGHFIYNLWHCLFSMNVITHKWINIFIFNPFTRLKLDNHPEQMPESIKILNLEPVFEPNQID